MPPCPHSRHIRATFDVVTFRIPTAQSAALDVLLPKHWNPTEV